MLFAAASRLRVLLETAAMAAKKKSPARKPKVVKKKAVKQKPSKQPIAKKKPAPAPEISLGRPLVTQEEKLYMLFKDDYHARQIFEFLRVYTLKELEELSPQQIVRRVSKPVFDTVDRIRGKLAEMKRSLRDDEAFAKEYRDHSK